MNDVPKSPKSPKSPKAPENLNKKLKVSSQSKPKAPSEKVIIANAEPVPTPIIKTNKTKSIKEKSVKKVPILTTAVNEPTTNDNQNIPEQVKSVTIDTKSLPKVVEPKRLRFREYTLEDFELIAVLGRGSFGKVRKISFFIIFIFKIISFFSRLCWQNFVILMHFLL